jgi:signal transduction histidine kinase/CheY-like chemotaxis protein
MGYHGAIVTDQRFGVRRLSLLAVAGVAVFLAGRGAMAINTVVEVVAVVWPASGVGFVVVWLLGPVGLVPVLLGDFAVTMTQGVSPLIGITFALGNVLGAGVGVWLTRRFTSSSGVFDAAGSVLVFGVLGAGGSSLVSASIGTSVLFASGLPSTPTSAGIFGTWFLSDVAGVLLVAPLLLAWLDRPDDDSIRSPLVFGSALALGALALSGWVFLSGHATAEGLYSSSFLLLPLMVISAFKLGRRGLTLLVALAAVLAYSGTVRGTGPFGHLEDEVGLFLLQLFLVTLAWSTLLVHGLATELYRSRLGLQQQVARQTADLMAANDQLRREIADREAAETARTELEQRLARAERMEMIGTLAGGVAHDLNNILTGLLGYPELLLLKLEPDSPLRRSVEVIRQSGQQAAAIVQDLLTLARRGVREEMVLAVNRLIRDHLQSVQHRELVDRHLDVAFTVELDEDLLNVRGSAVHLEKVVANLVGNAFEACSGAGRVLIRTINVTAEAPIAGYEEIPVGDWVVLSVRDDGVGMDSEEARRIFEPFFSKKQLGRSGTGLGMAVVWGSVKDHGGFLDVVTAPGEGTTVSVYLPATRAPASESGTAEPVAVGGDERILVVDDVEIQREIAAEILEPLGYTVAAVASGEAAVEWFDRGGEADLLVLDMIMDPGIDGLETYRRIARRRPGQRALISSGFSETERVREALAVGVAEYLKKPYTVSGLAQAVRRVLDV